MQPKRASPRPSAVSTRRAIFWSATRRESSAPGCSSGIQLLSELEPQYAGQTAEAHGVRDDDNDVALENAVNTHAATPVVRMLNIRSDRSPALPVCQHFFSWRKYEIDVQKAAKNPTRIVVSIRRGGSFIGTQEKIPCSDTKNLPTCQTNLSTFLISLQNQKAGWRRFYRHRPEW